MESDAVDLDVYPINNNVSVINSDWEDLDNSLRASGEFDTDYEEYSDAKIASDIRKYRLKNYCKDSCKLFPKYSFKRLPRGKPVYFVLLMCYLERLAYFAAVGNIVVPFLDLFDLVDSVDNLIQSLSLYMVAHVMFPVVGWLADVWIGRYRMAHIGLWLLWIGYAAVTLVFAIEYATDTDNFGKPGAIRYLLPICFLVINLGSASFQANAIPFGADQIAHRSSDELSSYFYCYYWVRNLGAIFLFISFTCSNFGSTLHGIVFGFISTLSITIALAVNAIFNDKFIIDKKKRNPIKVVGKVYYSAIVVKRPVNRSAFSYSGTLPPPKIDLVKETHGGKFKSEEVEDAKTFGRLLTVLITLSGALMVWNGIVYIISVQEQSMIGGKLFSFGTSLFGECRVTDSFVWIINVCTILVVIPLLNNVIFPFLREYTPNMLKRIGIGYIFAILSPFVLLLITSVGIGILDSRGQLDNATETCLFTERDIREPSDGFVLLPVKSWLVIFPHVIITLSEVFLNTSSLEFFYAQSPHSMRGLMVGLFFFMWGWSDSIANGILGGFSLRQAGPPLICGFWYYLLFSLIAVCGFVFFIFVARWYKNRKRPVENEDEVFYRQTYR